MNCLKLHFPELTFAAAHYIPGHKTCGSPHGHTYFVRDLEILVPPDTLDEVGMSIDFGLIKGYFKTEWDHKFVIPKKDEDYWRHIYEETGYCPIDDNRVVLKYTTCEWMAIIMRRDLGKAIGWNEADAAMNIHFELWEGPNQAVKI